MPIKRIAVSLLLLCAFAARSAAADCYDSCYSTYQCALEHNDYCEGSRRNCIAACDRQNKKYYGAIAYSTKDGAFGWSEKWNDRKEAETAAIENCAKHGAECKALVWYYNSCGALAADGDAVGWGQHDSESESTQDALQQCRKQGGANCELKVSRCTHG